MTTIIAKNQTAGDLLLTLLSVPDTVIPASGQVQLTDWNTVTEIQNDPELLAYINSDQVLLNIDGEDQTKAQSLAAQSTVSFPVDDTTELVRDPVDTTKRLRLDAGAVTTGTTRIVSVPDKNVTLDDAADSRDPNTHASSHRNGGTDEVATATPAANAIPKADGSAKLDGWVTADVAGPSSATDNAVARFDGTTGKVVQGSDVVIDDDGAVSNVERIAYKTEINNGNSGATKTIDWTAGQKQRVTMTADCTFSFTAPAGPTNLLLKLVQDVTGGHDATWPGSVLWAKGKAPNLTNGGDAIDIVTFYYDGTNYFGVASLDFS